MTPRAHGPENAEFEIRKAFHVLTEGAVIHAWEEKPIPGVEFGDTVEFYKHAYRFYRDGNRLAAERWARASKHLSRAFAAEAKIAYLEAHLGELPFLEGGSPEDYFLRENSATTTDLINSVAEHVPAGFERMPKNMSHYLERARAHLKALERPDYKHELLRVERIRAAHEYGRVLEIMALAYEAEAPRAA